MASGRMPGRAGRCPPRRTTTPAAAGRRRPRRRGHAALERDRGHARRRHLRIPFPYPRTRAGTRMRRRRPGQAPASPTSCGCRARRWPAAWAASATTCAGRRAISTPTTWRRREPASGTCTTDPFGQNTPGADPEHIYRFAVRNRGGSWLNRRIWLSRDRSGVRATTPGKPGKSVLGIADEAIGHHHHQERGGQHRQMPQVRGLRRRVHRGGLRQHRRHVELAARWARAWK